MDKRGTPILRFPEFSDEWQEKKLNNITTKINSGKTPLGGSSVYTTEGIPFIRSQNVTNDRLDLNEITYITSEINNTMRNSIVKPKDVLLNITGASLGRSCVVPNDFQIGNVNQHVCIIRFNAENDPYFVQPIFSSTKGQKLFDSLQTGSGREGLNFQAIKGIELSFPSLPEQQKIASFLTAIDAKIELLTKKKILLEQYKKGVMQQLFSQQIRFKDENGNDFPEWEEKQFEEVFERITRKNKENNTNVLTISAQYGLISQIEFFNKSVAAQDLTGYYLLERGDFAYNKSYSNGYPMGAIKRLTAYPKGVVSTLYICFRINEGHSAGFYDQYFNSGFINHEIHKIAQEGARNHGLLNVSVIEFFRDITLACPSKKEQDKISRFLHGIDRKVNTVDMQLDLAKAYKKGLLQQLFC